MTPNDDDPFPGLEASAERLRLRSRTVPLPDGRRPRIRLEASFWEGIAEILDRERLRLPELIMMMEQTPGASPDQPMAARLRYLVIHYFHQAAMQTGGPDTRTNPTEVIPFEAFRRRRDKD